MITIEEEKEVLEMAIHSLWQEIWRYRVIVESQRSQIQRLKEIQRLNRSREKSEEIDKRIKMVEL